MLAAWLAVGTGAAWDAELELDGLWWVVLPPFREYGRPDFPEALRVCLCLLRLYILSPLWVTKSLRPFLVLEACPLRGCLLCRLLGFLVFFFCCLGAVPALYSGSRPALISAHRCPASLIAFRRASFEVYTSPITCRMSCGQEIAFFIYIVRGEIDSRGIVRVLGISCHGETEPVPLSVR